MWCAECEAIDKYFFDQTTFWLFLPTVDSFGKVATFCGAKSLDAQQCSSYCIQVTVPESRLDEFMVGLFGSMEAVELRGTKVTTTKDGSQPDIEAMGRVVTADVLINRYKGRWIVEAVESEQFETWFQPIVSAKESDSSSIFAHEGLFRIRDKDGSIIPPGLAFSIAESSDLLFSLDLVARRSAVEYAAKARLNSKIFVNFNPSSVYDPAYCLRSTASAISQLGLSPDDIVFEITETHRVTDINHLKGILAFYRNAGFGVALDDIGSGWSGLNLLEAVRPDYVKIDMDLVRDVHANTYKQNIVENLIRIARANGVRVISEGVEIEEEAQWLKGAGTDFMQGYLFGKPELKDTVVSNSKERDIESSVAPLDRAASKMVS